MTGNFVSLYKTRKKGKTAELKLKCVWISGELNTLVIDGNKAWSGKFSAEEIENFSDVLGITKDEYITECQQALSGGEAVENFLFTVENNRFVWRKELEADTKVKFGSIKLSPVPLVQALEEFVDFAFETVGCCRQEVNEAKNKMGYFETERAILVQKIEEYTQNKKEIENILYSKFLCVLNAKKERIAFLEEELSDLKSKIQHSANEPESNINDTTVITKPSSKTTRETRKTNRNPYQRRGRQSPPSTAVGTELQMLSEAVENNETQTTHSSSSRDLKHKQNVRQKGQQKAKINPHVESVTTSHKEEESDPCTSNTFVEQMCKQDVVQHTGSTLHQPSKNNKVQQKTQVVRCASPIASTSTAVIPLENHIPVKYETPDQFVSEEQGISCIPSRRHTYQKSPPLVKRGVDDHASEQIKDVAASAYSSVAKGKTTQKMSEIICPIDLVSQKINVPSDISQNNVNKLKISKNNKKAVSSPPKQYRELEIISPLDMLGQPKPLTPYLVHEDTVCSPKNNSLKRPVQSVNVQDNSSSEFFTEGTNVCQEAVTDTTEGVVINDVNANSRINSADMPSVTVPSINLTKNHTEGEGNHYDSETDVDEPEDICKLSAKHRSGILEDSNQSSLAASEYPEAKCDDVLNPGQKNAIENLLNDSQDTDCSSEESPVAPLPKRTRRVERINKCGPMTNKSINHFTTLSRMQDKSIHVSPNMHSVYEQETQIADTQKLLDELG